MLMNNNNYKMTNLARGAAGAQNPSVIARPDGGTCTDPLGGPLGPKGPFGPKGPLNGGSNGSDPSNCCIFGWGAWFDLIPHMIHVGHEEKMMA